MARPSETQILAEAHRSTPQSRWREREKQKRAAAGWVRKKAGYAPTPEPLRFWPKVDVTEHCWIWNAQIRPDGYGAFFYGNRSRVAHRWSYENLVGKIPAGLQIDHLCRNRACVNPAHLEAVTLRENLLRGVGFSAKNARKSACPRGHEYNDVNSRIDKVGQKHCRPCQREMFHERKADHYAA